GSRIVIYNADFDCKFFPQRLTCAGKIECAMLAYSREIGEAHPYRRGEYRWHKLVEAARVAGFAWATPAHRALGAALACRGVWLWLGHQQTRAEKARQADERERAEAKQRRYEAAEQQRREAEQTQRAARERATEAERQREAEAPQRQAHFARPVKQEPMTP